MNTKTKTLRTLKTAVNTLRYVVAIAWNGFLNRLRRLTGSALLAPDTTTPTGYARGGMLPASLRYATNRTGHPEPVLRPG